MPARFRPPWSLVGVYAALLASLLLVAGPLSRVYFSSPLIGLRLPDAVPAAGGGLGAAPGVGDPVSANPGLVEVLRRDLVQLLQSSLLAPETLKGLLRVALPGGAGAGGGDAALARAPLSAAQLLRGAFESAGGIQLGRPWTLLAAELPAMHLVELPEDTGPLAVDVLAVLPQWRYEALLAAGRGEVPDDGEPAAPAPAPDPQQPVVLIYHTHATEAFLGPVAAGAGVDPNVVGFTTDENLNIMRVGAELARALGDRGVPTLQITERFDYRNGLVTRGGAYLRSLQRLQDYGDGRSVIDTYPSLRLLLDLHRDAVPRERVTAEGPEGPYARALIVVGSRDNPRWQSNLCVARRLDALMNQRFPELSRGVQVRDDARFNQHLPRSALLLEIGSVENTLEEAVRSARMLGEVIAEAVARNVIPEGEAEAVCP
ncbi:MAG TPA: stage II sporulation protein P [Bacillota bacterium]